MIGNFPLGVVFEDVGEETQEKHINAKKAHETALQNDCDDRA